LVSIYVYHLQFSWYVNPCYTSGFSGAHSFAVVDGVSSGYSYNNTSSRGDPFEFSRNMDPLKNIQVLRFADFFNPVANGNFLFFSFVRYKMIFCNISYGLSCFRKS
jgi:hypothetical protein